MKKQHYQKKDKFEYNGLSVFEQISLLDAHAATKMGIPYRGGKNVQVLLAKGLVQEFKAKVADVPKEVSAWRTTELGGKEATYIRRLWDGKVKPEKKEKEMRYTRYNNFDDYYDDDDDYYDDYYDDYDY